MPTALTAFDRSVAMARLVEETFDVLVVGGGITGAGVALDAAARGLRTALVERADFASGTSSRSSKLVHGGLRYLQQREIGLVYENLAERQRLLANAPHLVTPLPFLIPLLGREGTVNRAVARALSSALWMYDLTGGLRIGKRHRRIDAPEALAHLPTLRTDRLVAGFVYWDARTDDARLTLAVARTAVIDHGAVAANYLPVTSLTSDAQGRLTGARVEDAGVGSAGVGSTTSMEIRAAVVVNATGVWADTEPWAHPGGAGPGGAVDDHHLRPAKGIHLTLPAERLPCDMAAVIPVPADRRSIFVIPWGDQVYLGTTDTDYHGPLDEPRATTADVDYILDAVNAFVTSPVSRADVTGVWAGLRPLLADGAHGATLSARTADLSRRHRVSVDSTTGLVSVTGGKLTTYRKMAADTVDQVVAALGRGQRRSPTRSLPLRGAEGAAQLEAPGAAGPLGTDPATLAHLVGRYGGEAAGVLALVEVNPALARPLVPGQPYLAAEAVYAVRHEMARTLLDVLSRRTRALLRDRLATAAAAPDVGALISPELGWDQAELDRQVEAVRAEVAEEGRAAGLPPEVEAGLGAGAGGGAGGGTGASAAPGRA